MKSCANIYAGFPAESGVKMAKQVGNGQLMQKMNRLKVLDFIRRNPDISRPIIAEQTGLSLSSITNVTSYLLESGLLTENGTEQADRVGRKSTLLRFNAEAYGLILASLTEKQAEISYTDLDGRILRSCAFQTEGLSQAEVLTLLEQNIAHLLQQFSDMNPLAIGVILSGLVLDNSRFVQSSSMKWRQLDIKKHLEQCTSLPVFVENISRVKAVWYANHHQKRNVKNLLFVDLENGIGAVQLSYGNVNRSFLGEIGHTTIEKDGEPCFCGNKGCLEAMCSAERVRRLYAQQTGKSNISLAEIATLYSQYDPAATRAILDCSQYLGIGLANLITLLHPSVLVFNTGDFTNCPMLLEEAIGQCRQRTFATLTQDIEFCQVNIHHEQALSGAAFELCDRLFDINSKYNPVQ